MGGEDILLAYDDDVLMFSGCSRLDQPIKQVST